MVKLAAGRITSALITAGGWLVFGARLVLDLIGYSTVPEDALVAKSRIDMALDYLLQVPWWASLSFATVATLWLMHVSWPRGAKPSRPATGDYVQSGAAPVILPGKMSRPALSADGAHELATFASISILFPRSNAPAKCVASTNIWAWHIIQRGNDFQMYVLFDKPTNASEVDVFGTDTEVPHYHVWQQSERHNVIYFSQRCMGGMLRVDFRESSLE